MGNCQAATVVIQNPSNKVERINWSVSARQVMSSHPGHFVALVLTSPKQLKLLRPDDTLLIGQVYRLITVQDVLKEFAAKKCVKLGKLLKERGMLDMVKKIDVAVAAPASNQIHNGRRSSVKKEQQEERMVNRGGANGNGRKRVEKERVVGRHQHQQWKPALQSIAEIGT